MGVAFGSCCGKRDGSADVLGSTDGCRESALVLDNSGRIDEFYTLSSQPIGEGGFGYVVKGTNKATGDVRAVKVQSKHGVSNIPAFIAEIEMMKSLDHANILNLFEVFEDRQRFYLVMELCEGGELFDRIIEASHLSEAEAATVMQQILRAIAYMHHVHIAHRDMKPENCIFVDKKPIAESTLKVIDFGIAKNYVPGGAAMKTKVGTAYYVAPEVRSQRGYSEACDLWSCGVIMYILLVGAQPFDEGRDDKDAEIMKTAARCTDKKLREKMKGEEWGNVSDEAKDLVINFLQVDVKKRYTAERALDDNWVAHQAPKSTATAPKSLVSNIKAFQAKNKFVQMALRMIAWRLDDSKIKALREVFAELDDNNDGVLTPAELHDGLKKAHSEDFPTEQLEAIIAGIHADGRAQIDYTEFIAMMLDRKTYLQKDVCWQAFRVYDKNGDGKIDRSELEAVFKCGQVEKVMGAEAVEKFMLEVDKNGDGELDFDEFMDMMLTSG